MADIIFPGQEPEAVLGSSRLPENLDLEIWQGDAQDYYINMTDEFGVALNLTGYTAQAVIRASFNSATVYSFTCTITGNQIRVYMSSATCATIPAGSYIWNFQLTAPNGDVRTYLAGDVTVYAEVDPPS